MFIDITKRIKDCDIEFAISPKDTLQKELLSEKAFIDDETFNLLMNFINLEESVCLHFKLFYDNNLPSIFRKIYNYNLYYMSMKFIKDFCDNSSIELICEYSEYYGIINLKYKNITLLKITYSNSLLTIIYYFSDDIEQYINISKETIVDWLKYKRSVSSTVNTAYDYQKYLNYTFAKFFYSSFKSLTKRDITIINNFYNCYIKALKIDLIAMEKNFPIIATIDLCYPHFWKDNIIL